MSTLNDRLWYYTKDSEVFGPLPLDALREMVRIGSLAPDTYVAAEGATTWQMFAELASQFIEAGPAPVRGETPSGSPNLLTELAGKVSQASGLEKLEGFSLSLLFSEVFRPHTPEELEEHFSCGTASTTPPLELVVAAWPTPWAFFRLFGLSMGIAFAFFFAIGRFDGHILIPAWMFAGCCGIPISVLVFFMESNILRNVSIYRISLLVICGGCLSLIFSLLLYEITHLDQWLGAMSAGIVEEAGKLAAVVLLARNWSRNYWTLNGLLFGAAVGTGFSAFESAGYVLGEFSREDGSAVLTMAQRAFLSPFTHTIWTAAAAGALWRGRGRSPLSWGSFTDIRSMRIFWLVAALHVFWNSPIVLPFLGPALDYLGARLILGLIGWIVILLLIQAGIREVQQAKTSS